MAFTQAMELARRLDERIQDRAFCNLASTEIELEGDLDATIPRLRAIVVKGLDLKSARLAAYHLARIYDLREEFKKALFYARVARERSERTGYEDWMASSYNQIGSLLIAESQFEDARAELEKALELMPHDDPRSMDRALVKENLGYCLLVQKEYWRGFRLLFEALRSLRRAGAYGRMARVHQSLCFGYLELGRFRPAARHGVRSLQLAEDFSDSRAAKIALFLLGEVQNMAGNLEEARAYFSRLQEQYFPEHQFLVDFLLAVDVRSLVNLKA